MNGALNFKGFVDYRRDAINGRRRDAINRVSTQMDTETGYDNQKGGITGVNNPMVYENISKIIRWYKGGVSFEMHKTIPGFSWQSRFHDHIIRDETSYHRIREYIHNNPQKWKNDDFYTSP